ncbi:MAG: adenosylcobinamide amidohydrolase [Synergistaceae bacterium]|jgi:adenosylcobinamide amidohydrolase/ABC-type Fe3+-hydroxamate transport system substrate-binding protein|nr:adenosylcobinamide amidohydrolase [Synergistaceae bacterium]
MTDDAGQLLEFNAPPSRVVSLLPSATEVLCSIGAGDALVGVTYQDAGFEKTAGLQIVGGTSTPQFNVINALSPDLLIVRARDFERAYAGRGDAPYRIMALDDDISLEAARARLLLIGEIFGKKSETVKILGDDDRFIETIRLKTAKIPPERRKRVMLVNFDEGGPSTPGNASFQTETIKAAGGVTGKFGDGKSYPLTPEMWREFSPDFVFTAEPHYGKLLKLIDSDGWRDVPAARNRGAHSFPEALVGRAAAHVGYFAAWLSSSIYGGEFSMDGNLVHPMEVTSERAISIDMPYVERARIVESRIMDFTHRTLLIDFKRPQSIASTVTGERSGIETVGNSYSPTQVWPIYHSLGFGRSRDDLFKVLRLDPERVDIMLTGADMNNISIQSASYRDMTATAIVTAGVEGNAIRTSKDTGAWYEPGTINVLVMTNHNLSKYAATRAIVTATEAKTAALWDMDIRSVQTPLHNPATGTGTDTVIIVAGEGTSLTSSGGHSKMGELIAEAVHMGVQDAILKQNGKAVRRSVFERLEERGLPIGEIFKQDGGSPDFQLRVEELMLLPKYKAFVEASFNLSDARLMGQVSDLGPFEAWAVATASDIAGREVGELMDMTSRDDLPDALKMALDALATGVKLQTHDKK